MTFTDFLYGVALLVSLLFPIGYIFYKKGNNKIFYIASCIGFGELVIVLLAILIAPISIARVDILPQLEHNGVTGFIEPLYSIIWFIEDFYPFNLLPIIGILIPILIYRRYSIFHPIAKSD